MESLQLLTSILGITRLDIRPTAAAVDLVADLLFERNISPYDVRAIDQVYAPVAQSMGKTTGAVARSVARTANLCWDSIREADKVEMIFGRRLTQAPAPCEVLFYLAHYQRYGKPYNGI